MDSFQGSIPLSFISFYLDNQTSETGNTSNLPRVQQTTSHGDGAPTEMNAAQPGTSPQSIESEVDVNAYAEAKMHEMEAERSKTLTQPPVENPISAILHTEVSTGDLAPQALIPIRSSTPVPEDVVGTSQVSLNALESGLRVVDNPGSQLPELLPATTVDAITDATEKFPENEDCESSVCEAPVLPIHEPKVRFLADLSEPEKTGGETSSVDCPSLYGEIPGISESGEEVSYQHDATAVDRLQSAPIASTSHGPDTHLPELSGRARAILKTYFDETNAFRIPPGQTAVVFTESQAYHLLRVLTDETLRMSHSVMERMILDAVRGRPTTAPSRTGQFKLGARAQTPFRSADSDSSDGETGGMPAVDSDFNSTDYGELGDSSSFGESDSAGEMALISATFKAPVKKPDVQTVPPADQLETVLPGSQDTDRSSQDATLSEVRERTLKSQSKLPDKKTSKPKRQPQRGVPMREEFFAKIGWTRSFISGPADPLHNPYMVWCHICKKNFSIRSKGTMEILRHHRTEKHLRKDQRWRYEHLKSTDPITLKTQHRVRGRNGKVLTKLELAKELPKFINVELVDIGERFPFYEDFIQGRTAPLITPESRAKTQLGMVADFIQSHGDIAILRSMWAKISSVTDHQVSLCDFDWGEERMTVSIIFPYPIVLFFSEWSYFDLFHFQAIFQHFFNCALRDVAEQVSGLQCFGLEFEDQGSDRFMSVRFWKGQTLSRVIICRSSLPTTDLTGELGSIARLLSAISTKADVVACSGCPSILIRTIDEIPTSVRAVQSCFRFSQLNLSKLMHKQNYSVFGHVDFFSVLRGLIISLGGSGDEDWVQRSPVLAKVSDFIILL